MADVRVLDRTPRKVAEVLVTRDADGNITAEWHGAKSLPSLVSWALEDDARDDFPACLPWPMAKVATVPSREMSVYRRLDG